MGSGISITAVFVLLALAFAVIGLPILMVKFCIHSFSRSGSSLARVMSLAGIAVCLTPLVAVASYVAMVGPGRSGVLTQGTAPGGQEYCIVQTFKDLVEPYQVSFYIRDADGIWRWYYLEHEDNAWRSASVAFSGETATISRNGKPFREITMPTGTVDLAAVPAGYKEEHYYPAKLTIQEMSERHNERYD